MAKKKEETAKKAVEKKEPVKKKAVEEEADDDGIVDSLPDDESLITESDVEEAMLDSDEEVEGDEPEDDTESAEEPANQEKMMDFYPGKLDIGLEQLKNGLKTMRICQMAMVKTKKDKPTADFFTVNEDRTIMCLVTEKMSGKKVPDKDVDIPLTGIENDLLADYLGMHEAKTVLLDYDGSIITVTDDNDVVSYFTPKAGDARYRIAMEKTNNVLAQLQKSDNNSLVFGKEKYTNLLKFKTEDFLKIVAKAMKIKAEYHVFIVDGKDVTYRYVKEFVDIDKKSGGKIPITPSFISVKGKQRVIINNKMISIIKLMKSDEIFVYFKDEDFPIIISNPDFTFVTMTTPLKPAGETDEEGEIKEGSTENNDETDEPETDE